MVFCNCKQDGLIIFRLKTGRILKQILKQIDWRKIMKKVLALILALCMVVALCACGQSAAPAATEEPAAADAPAAEAPAEAEAWAPSEPITLIVPFGAGGQTDLVSRAGRRRGHRLDDRCRERDRLRRHGRRGSSLRCRFRRPDVACKLHRPCRQSPARHGSRRRQLHQS